MVLLSIYIQHGDICLQSLHRLTGARPLCRYATSPRTAGSHPLQGSLSIEKETVPCFTNQNNDRRERRNELCRCVHFAIMYMMNPNIVIAHIVQMN